MKCSPDGSSAIASLHDSVSKWRRRFIASSWIVGLQLFALGTTLYSARLELGDHRNLYYQLWKSGFRPYDQEVALKGIIHDPEYRKALVGLSRMEFERRFPKTFWEFKTSPPAAQPGETWLVSDYQAAQSNRALDFPWIAIFKDGLLQDISIHK